MYLNDQGHIVTADGRTTTPQVPVGVLPMFYVGAPTCFISFTFMALADRRVVLHSYLQDPDTDTLEDFIYEVVDWEDAYEAAESMVKDAIEYMSAAGYWLDENETASSYLMQLTQLLESGLH